MRFLPSALCLAVVGAVTQPLAAGSQELVSADSAGEPVPTELIADFSDSELRPLDVSADGRYVLMANFDSENRVFGIFNLSDSNCKIYRKDRSTGDLLTVFASEEGVVNYCSDAKMSADGNIVVISPTAAPENVEGERVEDQRGRLVYRHRIIALMVANIDSGTRRNIWSTVDSVDPFSQGRREVFSGYNVYELSANGRTALLGFYDGFVDSAIGFMALIDIEAETVTADLLSDFPQKAGIDTERFSLRLTGVSLSGDGTKIAVAAALAERDSEFGGIVCGQVGRCDFFGGENRENFVPPIRHERVYILDAQVLDYTEVRDLRRERVFTLGTGEDFAEQYLRGQYPPQRTLRADSLSDNGRTLTWLEFDYGTSFNPNCYVFPPPGATSACGSPGSPCLELESCEIRVVGYNFNTRQFRETYTRLSETTTNQGALTGQLSANGRKLLYARSINRPFGGDFAITPPNRLDYLCVSRASVDNGSGVPVEEACVPGGPVPQPFDPDAGGGFLDDINGSPVPINFNLAPFVGGPVLSAPVLWYIVNLNTGKETLVAQTDGTMFHAGNVVMSDDGRTVAFQSRDPRLRDDIMPDESMLPEQCFWPNGPDEPNLRVVTNDNATFYTSDTQYVYADMPALCLPPIPEIEAQVFAADVLPRPAERVNSSSSSFGWLLAPLVGLALLRRRRLH